MARTPDAGQARTEPINVRVTKDEKAKIDRSRGTLHLSTWARQAFEEKVARDAR